MASPTQTNTGLFVPTTNVWEISQLQEADVNSAAFKELLVRLYQNVNNISIALNLKDSAYYVEEEFVNGQVFPRKDADSAVNTSDSGRQVFRKLINFGALPDTASKSVVHNVTILDTFNFTRIYGCASDQSAHVFIPLPYASSVAANNVELSISDTDVTITTGSDRSTFTNTWIIIEFLKD